jgi:5-methylcytosine-specific restriction endonuclease McrA
MSKLGRKYISEDRYSQYKSAKDLFTRREIRREMYKNYLSSNAWKTKRCDVLKRAGGVCEECRFNEGTDVHHLTYQRLFRESLDDLVLLCRACHTKHHELRDTKYGHSSEIIWTPDMITQKKAAPVKASAPVEKKDTNQLALF